MKTLQEYLMEAIANGRFKVSSVVNKIILLALRILVLNLTKNGRYLI